MVGGRKRKAGAGGGAKKEPSRAAEPEASEEEEAEAVPTPASKKGGRARGKAGGGKAATAKGRGRASQQEAEEEASSSEEEEPSSSEEEEEGGPDAPIKINRAPVLALWVAVVGQRQGFSWEEALTFGKLIQAWFAQKKGQLMGIYEKKERSEGEQEERRRKDEADGVERVDIFGLHCPSVRGPEGERLAYSQGKAITPGSVQGYLKRAFKGRLQDAKAAMEELAAAVPADQLGSVCYKLYERLRPEFKGWGAPSKLDLVALRGLAASWDE